MNLTRLTTFAALLSALVLAACGGNNDSSNSTPAATKPAFTALVTFGDSLSDIGTYAPATSLAGNGSAPYFGGKFTTNSATGTVWVENLAATLHLTVTPAEVGFNGASVKCPAAAASALAATCTAYGQGGARVTSPAGIGHNADGTGALTVPVVTQIANHLARFTSFKATDLVLVYAGNNDVLIQFQIFAGTAAAAQASAAAGTITPAQADAAVATAQRTAREAMVTAAMELAASVKTQIVAKGATYVAVMDLSDIGDTPFGASLPATLKPALTDLSQAFNATLTANLLGSSVKVIDTYSLFKTAYQNPGRFGFVNNTVPACDAAKISAITGGAVGDGSSLFCNSTTGAPYNGLRSGADPITWQFADSVHPTTGGHKAISDIFTTELVLFGWL